MERRKFVIGLGALAAGSSAAVGSGAFNAAQIDGRQANIEVVDDSNALIGLEPGDTQYVEDNGDGQLMIDLSADDKSGSGVNPSSIYQIGGLGGEVSSENLDDLPGSTDQSAADVAIDTDSAISNEHAFKVMNQTDEARQIELTYDPNEDFPTKTALYLVAYYPEGDTGDSSEEEGLAVGDVTSDSDRTASILYDSDVDFSDDIAAGDQFYVTILVDVGTVDEGSADLGGELILRSGDHDNFTTPTS